MPLAIMFLPSTRLETLNRSNWSTRSSHINALVSAVDTTLMSSSGIRVKRGERLPDKELSLEAGAKRGGSEDRRAKGRQKRCR